MSRIVRGATRIIEGVGRFQKQVFGEKQSLFSRLGQGQAPLALFITCSDSRINPNLLTQTEPGELFILRNAGNLIPPQGGGPSGEAATIEYALSVLKVRELIVCGHSKCGAVAGMLAPQSVAALPAVRDWIGFGAGVAEEVERLGAGLSPDQRLDLAVQRNLLRQLEHVRTHLSVQTALAEGRLRLHGWHYRFETGEVLALDHPSGRFIPLAEARRGTWQPATPVPEGVDPSI